MSVSPEAFSLWNKQGLIPGPNESEEEFVLRAGYCQKLSERLLCDYKALLPFTRDQQATQEVLIKGLERVERLFGIRPSWVPVFFNSYRLLPWHGGCAWIFQLDAKSPTVACLQLRKEFRSQSTYLAIYEREELIAHECAHIGRMAYQESKFEEILAYRSSPARWRRWLGPIIESSWESILFISVLILLFLLDLYLLINGSEMSYGIMGAKSLSLVLVAIALTRLFYRQKQFSNCLNQLKSLYQDSLIAHHLIYRLSDEEIVLFSQSSLDAICSYMKGHTSFRWRFLLHNYPFDL